MGRITAAAKDNVRRKLLETAARHFAHHGLERANINTIAIEAGFAKGTVYNYFPSKEELFAAVLAEGARRAVERYASSVHGQSVREQLRALVAADLSVLREEEDFMKVVIREAMSFRPETYPLILEHLAPFVDMIRGALEQGAAKGEIRTDRPIGELAILFVGMLSLLYVQHWGSGGTWPGLDEVPDLVVTAFLDGATGARPR